MREEVDSALNDLRMSEKTKPLYEAVIKHIQRQCRSDHRGILPPG